MMGSSILQTGNVFSAIIYQVFEFDVCLISLVIKVCKGLIKSQFGIARRAVSRVNPRDLPNSFFY